MSGILTSIAGSAQCGIQITGLFQLLMYLLASFINTVFGLLWVVIVWILHHTLFNTGAGAVVQLDVTRSYAALSGLVGIVAAAALVWRALHMQLEAISGNRREDLQQMAGRVGTVFLWLAGGSLFVSTIIRINEAVVGTLTGGMYMAAVHTCPSGGPAAGVTDALFKAASLASASLLAYLFGEVFLALAVGLLLYVIVAWLVRLFEVIFWASLMPIALALSIADPQAKLWTYVKSQLVGAVFVQTAMAFGVWLVVTLAMQNGSIFGSGASSILSTGIALAGLFFVGHIPRYWQEMNGHSTGGGIDAAQLAMGYMGGRIGTQMLSATPAGQMLNTVTEAGAARSQHGLQSGTSLAGRLGGSAMFRRLSTSAAYNTAATENLREQDLAANPAVSDLQTDTEVARTKRLQDAWGRNPSAQNLHAHPERPLVPATPTDLTGAAQPDAATFAASVRPYAQSFAAARQRLIEDNPDIRGAVRNQTSGLGATPAMKAAVENYATLQTELAGPHPENAVAQLFGVSPADLAQPATQQAILDHLRTPTQLADTPAPTSPGPALGRMRLARQPRKLPPNYTIT